MPPNPFDPPSVQATGEDRSRRASERGLEGDVARHPLVILCS
jgi:hypothetical protein